MWTPSLMVLFITQQLKNATLAVALIDNVVKSNANLSQLAMW